MSVACDKLEDWEFTIRLIDLIVVVESLVVEEVWENNGRYLSIAESSRAIEIFEETFTFGERGLEEVPSAREVGIGHIE